MTEDAAVANIYIEIINSDTLLSQTFRGLFACARIYLGHKPNGHCYIFKAQTHSHFSFSKERAREEEAAGKVVVPFAGKESKDTFTLTCESMHEAELNIIYKDALSSLSTKGFNETKLAELKKKFNHHKFAKMLVQMYWLDMVTFAKHSADYNKNWRD
jgi:hypothetical protein